MFIISLTYNVSLAVVEEYLEEHKQYLKRHYDKGQFLLSGRKKPRTGGVIIATVNDHDQLDKILSEDPFYQHGVADYEIIEFTPTMTSDVLAYLKSET